MARGTVYLGTRSDKAVGDILHRHNVAFAPKRKQTISWKDFILAMLDLHAKSDCFSVGVFTLKGRVTYIVDFFIKLKSRRIFVWQRSNNPVWHP